jgi:hypothetical protein
LHSTPNTDDAEGWHGLLGALTDDELARYGEIAADQRRQEWRHAWAQLLMSGASVACLAWAVRSFAMSGLTWGGAASVVLSCALGYWPYRQAVVRRLWRRHVLAVEHEQARRRASEDA